MLVFIAHHVTVLSPVTFYVAMSNVSTMGFMAMQYVETLDGGGEGEVVEESRTKGNHRRVALDCKISTTTGRFRYYS